MAVVTGERQLFVQGYRVSDRRGALPKRQGAEPYETRPLAAITLAVVHYSGVDRDSTALEIANYQTTKAVGDPFPEIAYHFIVRQNGEIEQCHDLCTRTWHAGTPGNDKGVALCLPMLHGPTPLQADAAARLINAIGDRLKRPLTIKGHQELAPTQCPGSHWPQWRHLLLRAPTPPREVSVDGVPVKWAFYDWYRRLESIKRGLCGRPLAPHVAGPAGEAVQEFAGCTMRWEKGEMWIRFKSQVKEV